MNALAEVGEVPEHRAAVRHRAPARAAAVEARAPRSEALHVLTCGSVDDGKSTLIGRLLCDAGAVHADQRLALEKAKRTAAGTLDFSLLLDGLVAEREQGITIDVAWRYFDTAARRLVIIDAPGHEQYTRNMATGASHADLAILLVDARFGVKVQTRRHAAILHLMGVQRVVLAVNKMDLADWSEARFRAIERDFQALADRFGFSEATAIPVSAVLGDNVARRSQAMPWYRGPSLLEHLDATPARGVKRDGAFRFPVQTVVRAGQDFRGLAGTVTSGEIARGGEVVEALSGRRARVRRIVTMGRDLEAASAGQAVVLQLDTDLDVSRGAVLAAPGAVPQAARSLDARLVWLSDQPFARERGYLLRTATDLVPLASLEIAAHLDLDALTERPAATCAGNDIAVARVTLGRSAVVERYVDRRDTGSFVLVDAVTGATVAGGIVARAHAREGGRPPVAFRITRSLLRQGIGADLGDDVASERELRRRADEVAILLRGAGVAVEIEDRWQGGGIDARTVWLDILATLAFGFATAGNAGLRWLGHETPDVDKVRTILQRVVRDGLRASEIVGSVRAMFRKGVRERRPIDVRSFIAEALAPLHGELQSEQISVEVEVDEELPEVLADRVQLQQVLVNLIANAIDAMRSVRDRPRRLRLGAGVVESDGMLITVADTGSGIDAGVRDRIFDPFVTTKASGMGLGLPICRSIVEAHGGRVWASPGNPHGTVFRVMLPACDAGGA
jgi:bifunctional enzyme CysN/CysC